MDIEKGTKKRILTVARTLISRKGYSGVSMEAIAHGVGIKKPSLYYFFKNKDAIYIEILNEIVEYITDHYSIKKGQKPTKKLFIDKVEESLLYGIKHGSIIADSEEIDLKKNLKEILAVEKNVTKMKSAMVDFLKCFKVRRSENAVMILIDSTHAYIKRASIKRAECTPREFAKYLSELLIK